MAALPPLPDESGSQVELKDWVVGIDTYLLEFIPIGNTPPTSPAQDDLWIDTDAEEVPVTTLIGGLADVSDVVPADGASWAWDATAGLWKPNGVYAPALVFFGDDPNVA
ncbi:MAG: hypothetical protein LC687_01495, partial [Actinobacteria bacterium]|nr:hypothetical protein [Actinomycetota bacterium]